MKLIFSSRFLLDDGHSTWRQVEGAHAIGAALIRSAALASKPAHFGVNIPTDSMVMNDEVRLMSH